MQHRRRAITPSHLDWKRRIKRRRPWVNRRAVWAGPTMEERFQRAMFGFGDPDLLPLCRIQRTRTMANGGHPVR